MKILDELLRELGISKVNLAKYLGVSRQMVYNYLDMKSIDDWPKDKKTKLFLLLDVESYDDLIKIKPSTEYISRIEKMIKDTTEEIIFPYDSTSNCDFKDLNKKQQKLIIEILDILKEKLSDDEDGTAFSYCKYLFNFLQILDDVPELKYVLAYFSKANGFIPIGEYAFSEDKQLTFEGIMFQAVTLFNSGTLSKSKILEAHNRFEADVQQRKEEKLSRTQELNAVRIQALKELGYSEITGKNSTEVFEKMAEIQSRKI